MADDYVFCPLVDRDIDFVDCMENRDTKDEYIPDEYKAKLNWCEICAKCKWQEY